MLYYTLGPDESLFAECENVTFDGLFSVPQKGDLVVTNRNFITLVRYPGYPNGVAQNNIALESIKVAGGEAQISSNTKITEAPSLVFFYYNYRIVFRFERGLNTPKTVRSIENYVKHITTGQEIPEKERVIPGTEAVAQTLGSTFRAFKKNFKGKTPAAGFCTFCGAAISGIKDETVKCPYCGSVNKL